MSKNYYDPRRQRPTYPIQNTAVGPASNKRTGYPRQLPQTAPAKQYTQQYNTQEIKVQNAAYAQAAQQQRASEQAGPAYEQAAYEQSNYTRPIQQQAYADTAQTQAVQEASFDTAYQNPENNFEYTVLKSLSILYNMVKNARKIPFSDQCLLEREQVLFYLDQIQADLPKDMRRAQWILDNNKELQRRARENAEQITRKTRHYAIQMIDESEITIRAKERAEEIYKQALENRRQMEQDVVEFAGSTLSTIEEEITEALLSIKKSMKKLEQIRPEVMHEG